MRRLLPTVLRILSDRLLDGILHKGILLGSVLLGGVLVGGDTAAHAQGPPGRQSSSNGNGPPAQVPPAERAEPRAGDKQRGDDPRDRRWRGEERRGEKQAGPPFCRSGNGHPVFGMEWCRARGYGMGRYERPRYEGPRYSAPWYRLPDDRRSKAGRRRDDEYERQDREERYERRDRGERYERSDDRYERPRRERGPQRRAPRRSAPRLERRPSLEGLFLNELRAERRSPSGPVLDAQALQRALGPELFRRFARLGRQVYGAAPLSGQWTARRGRRALQIGAGRQLLAVLVDADRNGRVDAAWVATP